MPVEQPAISLPVPSVIIAVGEMALQAACQAGEIYRRGGPQRSPLTRFLALEMRASQPPQLLPLDDVLLKQANAPREAPGDSRTSSDAARIRQEALRATIKDAGQIWQSLERVLHEIRTHELLFEAGWGQAYDVPANFYLLADVTDPQAAGAALPLAEMLHEISASRNFVQAHLLLSTAVFPEAPGAPKSDAEVMVYTFLHELDAYLQPGARSRAALQQALELPTSPEAKATVFDPAIYLFDCRKEGSYMVKDPAGMTTMLGNALLGLLQRDLASQIHRHLADLDLQEHAGFYNSLGAACIVYDPASLQQACAGRIAAEFLEQVVLLETGDTQIRTTRARSIAEKTGALNRWQEDLLRRLPPAIAGVNIAAETSLLSLMLSGPRLPELDYTRLQASSWAGLLRAVPDGFRGEGLLEMKQLMDGSAGELARKTLDVFSAELDCLPGDPQMYPGGIEQALKTVDILDEDLTRQEKRIQKLQADLPEKRLQTASDLEARCAHMEQLFQAAPRLPWIIRILPRFVRLWLAPLYYARRYWKGLAELRLLQEECLTLAQEVCAADVQLAALGHAQSLAAELRGALEKTRQDLQSLDKTLHTAQKDFSAVWADFPLGQAENGWDGAFRIPAVDENVADWAYARHRPNLDGWLNAFCLQSGLFEHWRSLEAGQVSHWLLQNGIGAFAPLWKLDLDSLFALWSKPEIGFNGPRPLSDRLISNCMSIAMPLLRPNFDSSGGPGYSSVRRLALFSRPDWSNCCLPPAHDQQTRWETVYTGDQTLALFLQARTAVSLAALPEMLAPGRIKWEALSSTVRKNYEILSVLGQGRTGIVTETIDPEDPDLRKLIFEWDFKVRGKEVRQELTILLSKKRYEEYRGKERFSGQWNRYAEAEMPEIRQLAAEFARLHAGRRWSTLTQAQNVLRFVQACIPYGYDKDTTRHTDWARYPIETLQDRTGDCEDVAILCAAVLARLGFDVVLLLYPEPCHLAFGVAGAEKLKGEYVSDPQTGRRYFYGEATSEGWHLGQIPESYRGITPDQILPVKLLMEEEEQGEEEQGKGE